MTEIILKMILFMVLAYFIGAIPSAVLISKKFFGFDIRTKGSGNMGSTNAIRVLGTKWGIIVQICDILKGLIPVLLFADIIAPKWGMYAESSFLTLPILEIIIGISAILGHIFSCFVGFKGGKGVNTALGVLIVVMPVEVGVAASVFLLTILSTGYVSLSSLTAVFTVPLVLFLRYNVFDVQISGYFTLIYFAIALSVVIFFAHRSNIVRLFKGVENRFEKIRLINFKCCESKK